MIRLSVSKEYVCYRLQVVGALLELFVRSTTSEALSGWCIPILLVAYGLASLFFFSLQCCKYQGTRGVSGATSTWKRVRISKLTGFVFLVPFVVCVYRDLALDILSKAVVSPDLRDWEVYIPSPTHTVQCD